MGTISTRRSAYQNHNGLTTGSRQPFAGSETRAKLNEISLEATRLSAATTQAAYLMRLNNLRALMRSL